MWLSLPTAINEFRQRTGKTEKTATAVIGKIPKTQDGKRFKIHRLDLEEAIRTANRRPVLKTTTRPISQKKRERIREIGLPVRRTV